ncbi:MAG: DUF3025 domain-containing protein [Pseudomonadota bacterium]
MSLPAIDWTRPWLATYRAIGEPLAARVAGGMSVSAALNEALARQAPVSWEAGALRFVAQGALPPGEAYEAFIRRTACVPTRDNLHDFFNGLMWLHWPALKAGLNAQQAAEIARGGVGPTRGALRDALTLFDENGALLCAPPALTESLRARDWQRLFVERRPLWRAARLWLVGHALLEKLVRPRKAITAHVVAADAQGRPLAPVAKPFWPLPVLGVPGWWPGNAAVAFYGDATVFRPPGPGTVQVVSAGRKPSIDR